MSVCLHRAKRASNGEWIEGFYYKFKDTVTPFIMVDNRNGDSYEVTEDTVSRCLGLPCRNKECLWENDIIKAVFNEGEYIAIVKYVENKGSFFLVVPCECDYMYNIDAEELKHYDVIGNIIDNPELLELNDSLEDGGEYEVVREIDVKTDDGERLQIAYHTGIVIYGDDAVAANKVKFPKKYLETVKRNLKRIR